MSENKQPCQNENRENPPIFQNFGSNNIMKIAMLHHIKASDSMKNFNSILDDHRIKSNLLKLKIKGFIT